jgi:hypothetical protein
MLRKTMIVFATAATFTGVLTASAFARGFGGDAHMSGGFAGGGFRAPIIRSAIPRIHGEPFAHFPHRRSRYDAPWYSGYDYDLPWYGYYDPSTVAPDEQLTYPAPVVPSPPAPDAKVVSNPYSRVPSEEPDLLRPGELLLRFPPPKKISR